MEAIQHFTQSSLKTSVPELRAGDTVRVHQRIRESGKERIQIFEGVVMAVRGGKNINASFVVRRIASGVGVEKTFPLHSPNVVKVERLKSSKVRQARLFYLRERFGRAGRMSREVRNIEDWSEDKVEQQTSDAILDEANAENEPEASNDKLESINDKAENEEVEIIKDETSGEEVTEEEVQTSDDQPADEATAESDQETDKEPTEA